MLECVLKDGDCSSQAKCPILNLLLFLYWPFLKFVHSLLFGDQKQETKNSHITEVLFRIKKVRTFQFFVSKCEGHCLTEMVREIRTLTMTTIFNSKLDQC